jgi:hypothetical protein
MVLSSIFIILSSCNKWIYSFLYSSPFLGVWGGIIIFAAGPKLAYSKQKMVLTMGRGINYCSFHLRNGYNNCHSQGGLGIGIMK